MRAMCSTHIPCAPPKIVTKKAVGLGAHCLSSAAVGDVCSLPGRVAQPRLFATIEGTPPACRQAGRRGKPGSPSLGYFSRRDKKSNQPPGCPRQELSDTGNNQAQISASSLQKRCGAEAPQVPCAGYDSPISCCQSALSIPKGTSWISNCPKLNWWYAIFAARKCRLRRQKHQNLLTMWYIFADWTVMPSGSVGGRRKKTSKNS